MSREPRDLHVARGWQDTEIEDACRCPQERCGLVAVAKALPDCPQHGMQAAKTMRQMHYSDECPGRPALVRWLAGWRQRHAARRAALLRSWRFDWRHPRAALGMALGFGPHADGQAQWEIVSRLRWAASHYLCIGHWFWDGKDDCHKCGSQPSDVDFLMKRVGFRRAQCIDPGECQQFAEENAVYEAEEESAALQQERREGR